MNLSNTKQTVDSRVSGFDEERDYYIFEYVYDTVKEDYTEFEGDALDIVKATNSVDALEKAGYDDYNRYSAKPIEDCKSFKDKIKEERKTISKLNKKIDEIIAERDAELKEILEKNECPNGCGKMDDKRRCKECGFGFEDQQMLKDLESLIKEEKKKGNDVSELEEIRDAIKEQLKD